jgi:hypothetical protein
MSRTRMLAVAGAVVAIVSFAAVSMASASGMRQVKFTATLDASVRTDWSVPEQLLSSSCYHDSWEQGSGSEHITLHMSETKALAVIYSRRSFSIGLGSWQLYHGTAHARENVTRHGQTTIEDRPGNCGAGGGGPAIHDGPGGCGNRTGTPQVSLTDVGSTNRYQVYVSDSRGQIKPFTDCPVFYPSSDSVQNQLSPILGRINVKDLLNKKKRHITLHFQHHWHHGRGSAVTNYFISDMASFWTLELTRAR